MSLTVVVPHYGDGAPTRALVAMLAAQEGVTVEVVVVDDASPSPLGPLPPARVVRREVNGGFGSAVNTGVAEAQHALVLALNSDVEIGPGFLHALLEAATPWLPAVVSPRVVTSDGEEEWVGRRFPTTTQQTVEWLTPLARWRPRLHAAVGHDVRARGTTRVVDWVVGAALLFPTEAFREVGGFDERFHMNGEEVDLQRRLRELGLPSVVLGEPHLVHAKGGSTDPARGRRWLVDARMTYAEKWGGRRRLQAALTAATAVNLAVNGVRRAAGRDLEPLAVARQELDLIWRRP